MVDSCYLQKYLSFSRVLNLKKNHRRGCSVRSSSSQWLLQLNGMRELRATETWLRPQQTFVCSAVYGISVRDMPVTWSNLSHQNHVKRLLSQLLGAASEWEGIKAAVSGAVLTGTGRRGLCQHAALCVCVTDVLLRAATAAAGWVSWQCRVIFS